MIYIWLVTAILVARGVCKIEFPNSLASYIFYFILFWLGLRAGLCLCLVYLGLCLCLEYLVYLVELPGILLGPQAFAPLDLLLHWNHWNGHLAGLKLGLRRWGTEALGAGAL